MLHTCMTTIAPPAPRPVTAPRFPLSRQPACTRCPHESHWLACDWCECHASPDHDPTHALQSRLPLI